MIKLINKIYLVISLMGQVCTNPLEYLISEYGEDVGKFIVVEKTKEFFNEKYPEVKKNLNVQTTNFQKDIIQKVDEQSSSCITKITTNINELKESKKTEIATFEKTSNKNVDDFIGIKQLQTQFDGLKDKSKEKMAGFQKSVLSEADVLADKQRGLIQSQKPSIPMYDNLPQCLKDKVWEEGTKKFGPKIDEEKNKQEDFLKKALNFEEMKKKFGGGDLPTDEITHLSSSVEDKLNEVKRAVDLSGNLGGIGKKFGF